MASIEHSRLEKESNLLPGGFDLFTELALILIGHSKQISHRRNSVNAWAPLEGPDKKLRQIRTDSSLCILASLAWPDLRGGLKKVWSLSPGLCEQMECYVSSLITLTRKNNKSTVQLQLRIDSSDELRHTGHLKFESVTFSESPHLVLHQSDKGTHHNH